jgi:plastocyanin
MTGRINLFYMKKVIGLVLLLIVLVAFSGCTQQTKAPETTVVTTAVVTTAETVVEETPAEILAETPVETIAETPAETAAAATPEVTAEATTAPAAAVTAEAILTPSTKITTIHIVNGTFNPATLVVLPGTGITWTNDEATVHSVKVIGTYAGKFNSGDIVKGGSWGYTFGESEGTFQYADGYNPNLTGVIIVKKGSTFYGQRTPAPYITSNSSW